MFIFLTRLGRLLVGTTIVIAVTSVMGFNTLTTSPTSLVASHHQTPSSSTFALVLVNSTDGSAHWGQKVTFTVSTTKTTEPHVSLACSQSGAVVYRAETGYYSGYPWPWTQTMTLSSYAWTGGAASCTATLYYFSGAKTVTVTTLTFPVLA